MSKALLRTEEVRIRFAALDVLGPISLELFSDEILSILGPSGCGKTTLLRVIAGLEEPVAGKVSYCGVARNDIGFIFQKLYVFPWLTVFQNTQFGLSVTRETEGNRVSDILKSVGLAGFEEYYPYQLSGGMLQRVAISRALVLRPKLLLMDEPFGDLDHHTRHRLYDLVLKLREKYSLSIVLVTHDVDEAVYVSDRVVVLTDRPATILATLGSRDDPLPSGHEAYDKIVAILARNEERSPSQP